MPLSAVLRNLGKMTATSLLEPGSPEVAIVCERLRNEKLLKKVRVSLCILICSSLCMVLSCPRNRVGSSAFKVLPRVFTIGRRFSDNSVEKFREIKVVCD